MFRLSINFPVAGVALSRRCHAIFVQVQLHVTHTYEFLSFWLDPKTCQNESFETFVSSWIPPAGSKWEELSLIQPSFSTLKHKP